MSTDEIRAWKEQQARKGLYPMWSSQPRYESIVRLGYMRYGLSVRRPEGTVVVHEIDGRGRNVGPST